MAKPIWSGLSLEHVFEFYFGYKPRFGGSIVKVEHNGHRLQTSSQNHPDVFCGKT